jgi:anti-anti-sigma regulatory factor
VVNDHEARVSMLAWLALFDVLQRMGDKTAVDDLALKFVVAFERSPPVWDDARRATRDPATTEAKSQGSAFVRFSGELAMDNPGLESFSKAIGTSSKCRIDFSGIHSADEDASGKLAEMLRNLRRKSYSMQVQGGDALRRVLEARVRVGEPVGESYWALLLELLQWLQDSAEFEEQAVNYAISFEVSPPSWEGLTEQQVSQARIAAAEPGLSVPGASDTYVLEGVLTGPGESQVMRVREFAKDNPTLTIDCSRLERIDFVCAGALLNELEGVERAHKPIQLVSASPVVQALLLVIGIKARYFHPRLQ